MKSEIDRLQKAIAECADPKTKAVFDCARACIETLAAQNEVLREEVATLNRTTIRSRYVK